MNSFLLVLLLFIFSPTFALLCPETANAQWPNDPTINVPICIVENDQYVPIIVSDGVEGAIIIWRDTRNGLDDLYAQRVDALGNILWTVVGIPVCTAAHYQYTPSVISDGDGGAFIVWDDKRNGSDRDIYTQRIDASGEIQWTVDGVPIIAMAESQSYPKIASDGAGGIIVTWIDYRNGNGDIYAQRIDEFGNTQWTVDGVPICTAAYSQSLPKIAYDGTGGAIITWNDYRSDTNTDIYAQRIDCNGIIKWTANGVPISSTANNQEYPEIVPDGSGGAIITWRDQRSGNNYSDLDIYAQRIDSLGNVLWTVDGIPICTAPEYQQFTAIVSDGAGGAIIAWQDHRSGILSDIYAQRVDASGNVQWATDGVPICTTGTHNPVLIPDGAGGAIITWGDYRGVNQPDIYIQRIDALGNAQWTANGVPICIAVGGQGNPTIVSGGNGGTIITWMDPRNGNADIYAQQVSADGELGDMPPVPDFVVERIEVAQAVVSPSLVQHKATVVRVFLDNIGTSMGEGLWINGWLHVLGSNDLEKSITEPTSSMYWPPGGVFSDGAIQAGSNSMNFYLHDLEVDDTQLSFWVEIDFTDEITEQDETNNSTESSPLSQSFLEPARLRVAYCSVAPRSNGFHTGEMQLAYDLISKMFPVPSNTSGDWHYIGHVRWGAPNWLGAWDDLARYRLRRALNWENKERRKLGLPEFDKIVGFFDNWPYEGVLGKSTMNSREVLVNAATISGTRTIDNYQRVVAHEIGHTLGLYGEYYSETETENLWRTSDPEKSEYVLRVSDCPLGTFPCFNYPSGYRTQGVVHGRFVEESAFDVAARRPAAWGPESEGAWTKTAVMGRIGFHLGDPNEIHYWEATEDQQPVTSRRRIGFMGDAKLSDGFAWINTDIYEYLVEYFNLGDGAPLNIASAQVDSHQIWITALIDSDDNVQAPSWLLVETGISTDVLVGTGYSIDFIDGSGSLLASHPFGLTLDVPDTALVLAQLPFPAATQRIEILKESTPIFGRDKSQNIPTVTLKTPNGGALSDTVLISWTADDVDGDSTEADLFYSPDNGISWLLLEAGVTDSQLVWSTASLPGSDAGLMRVVVTDGIQTAEDISTSPFTVGKKPPAATISSPTDSARIVTGSAIIFEGTLIDPEDGDISHGLVWFSSLAGTLGTGSTVYVASLIPGIHTVHTSGLDSDSNVAMDSITLSVLIDSDGDGLPDEWENLYPELNSTIDDSNQDPDGDQLTNYDEYFYGTDPTDADTDGDGFDDGTEIACSTDPLSESSDPTAIEISNAGLLTVAVSNFPNPFNPSTTIRYSLPSAGEATLKVYDVLGRLVVTLVNEYKAAGSHQTIWDATNQQGEPVASGIYFYRLKAGGKTLTKKMVLLK